MPESLTCGQEKLQDVQRRKKILSSETANVGRLVFVNAPKDFCPDV